MKPVEYLEQYGKSPGGTRRSEMKLLVLHIPNTLNYGSMMMAENLFFYLSRELAQQDLELVIATPRPRKAVPDCEKYCSRSSII